MADHAFPELHGSRAGKKARVHIVYITFTHHLTSDRRDTFSLFFHYFRIDFFLDKFHDLNISLSMPLIECLSLVELRGK